ncbi:MAG: hypothetical protein ACLUI3_14480 [Christensenellales bacterium]
MYAGRLGSMTFMILLTRRKPPAPVQYPEIRSGDNEEKASARVLFHCLRAVPPR